MGMSTKMDADDWAHTPPDAAGRLRTIAASSRRFISSPSRTLAGALCRSASVLGTACGKGFGRCSAR